MTEHDRAGIGKSPAYDVGMIGSSDRVDDLAGVHSIAVAVPDHVGRLAGKIIPVERWPEVLAGGLSMPAFHLVTDLSDLPVPGMGASGRTDGFRDGRLVADPSTLRRLPWDPGTAIVICDVQTGEGAAAREAPRTVLAQQVDRLANHGLTASVATELEFYLYEGSYFQANRQGYRGLKPLWHRRGDNDLLVANHLESFVSPLRDAMRGLGWPATASQGEGGIGQVEINTAPGDPIRVADAHVLFKHATKVLAARQEVVATFLAKVDEGQPGSSCHVHISLQDSSGEAVFPGEQEGLSSSARRFLAGLLAHTPGLTIMHAPYENSYRRLRPDSWAPSTVTWGWDNRSCLVRTVGSGPSLRFELRLPGADVNPYLCLAALLAAGIAGLEDDGLELPDAIVGDGYRVSSPDVLPRDLTEAVQRFESSALARKAFGDDVFAHLLGHAIHERDEVRRRVTDVDRERGFEAV